MTSREWAISENGIYSPYDNNNPDIKTEELEEELKSIKKEKWRIEDELEECEANLKFFIKNFIELGNKEDDLHDAYAKLFEIYKGHGYEKYYQENK